MPSNLNNSIRIVIAVVYALTLALFILLWEARLIPIPLMIPVWLGFIAFLPLLAYIESLAANSLIQYLGCQKVNFVSVNEFIGCAYINCGTLDTLVFSAWSQISG